MHSTVKKTLSLFLAVLMLCASLPLAAFAAENYTPVGDRDWLRTEGERIVNADGETVVLRGANFGGWGIMEDWFCPFNAPSGEEIVYQTLVSRFGQEAAHALFQNYRSNWITEQDYKNVAELGMNVIRLPIWYRNFQSDDNGTWYRDAAGNIDFSELDQVVSLCKKYGLYLIIDLHGLPGYQNDYDHCGQSKSMSLFDDTDAGKRYREVVTDFWVTVAARYADEPTIAMYDLMNEPLGTNITREKGLQQAFWDFSDALYKAIRAVDNRHIITMEAIWDPSAIPSPDVYGWENIVYQEHLYDVSNPAMLHKANEIRKADYGSPFYIGEFYPRGIASFDYMLSLYNKRELNWTTWTYKGTGGNADTSPWFLYGSSSIEKIDYENDSYETIAQKWGACLRTDSGAFARTAFADYVQYYTDGTVDKVALYTLGAFNSVGSFQQRWSLFKDKIKAIYTTILDWIRKLKTGDLL
ncbi:MAG: cellulase family glycosylhydrolase [Clostridia bacterium]|nr:cellulase family glycosylhydrolase [Clostridia bacterium]